MHGDFLLQGEWGEGGLIRTFNPRGTRTRRARSPNTNTFTARWSTGPLVHRALGTHQHKRSWRTQHNYTVRTAPTLHAHAHAEISDSRPRGAGPRSRRTPACAREGALWHRCTRLVLLVLLQIASISRESVQGPGEDLDQGKQRAVVRRHHRQAI
ncbi:hypothetical protein BC628DRAFT_1356600 [Trametes gibbosa]|nr:hypothetical protein BC628DRAFT_1356600 [Trametes gibbosa]